MIRTQNIGAQISEGRFSSKRSRGKPRRHWGDDIAMGVDAWVDRGTILPLLLEVEGTPYVLSPLFFGGKHFCTNAHGIHCMIGAIFVC